MPRIRSIKPEFWIDEKVARLSRDSRLLFLATLSMADDYGNLRGNPAMLKARSFAYDDDLTVVKVAKLRDELMEAGFLLSYVANGENLIHIMGWAKHQRVDKPGKPHFPGPSDEDHAKPSRDSSETLAPRSGIGDRGSVDRGSSPMSSKEPDAPPADAQEVFDYWKEQMGKAKARFIPKRRTAIKARFKEGYTVEDCKLAIDGCKASSYHMGENTEGKDGAGVVYDGFQLIFRAGNVERFQGYATNKPKLKDGIQADGIYREPNRKDKVLF